jgi:bifunctional DNase/RNase
MTDETAVEMFVGGLVLDPNSQAPVVVLKDESGELCLPIWIGMAEATSIATAIKQVNMERPLTHDLMYDIFGQLDVKIERVVITELKESTYYAELIISQGDKVYIIDSRPSDAIAIALRASAPIFVAQAVLDQAKISFTATNDKTEDDAESDAAEGDEKQQQQPESGAGEFRQMNREQWEKILEELDPEDFKYKV